LYGNIALVGCGAVAQQYYLPAIAKRRGDFARVWLVDTDETARQASASMVNGEPAPTLSDIPADLAFVIIGTPNASHFSLATTALARGAHVLIEKPFVIWPEDARKLIEIGAESQRTIAVNQTRRFFPHTRELRRRIRTGEFGRLLSVVHHEGFKFTWAYGSGGAFAKGAQRTGVIMDTGVHVIDFYHYLLDPEWTVASAIHDGFLGPEGLAEVALTADGAPVTLRLSRYQRQENRARLSFEAAEILINIFESNAYSIQNRSGAIDRVVTRPPPGAAESVGEELLLNFVAAGEGREAAVCDAASSLPVIEILDEIYRIAHRYPTDLGSV
jgi:predicted dehydrogenase